MNTVRGNDLVLTATERLLIKNFRAMQKSYQTTLWEVIEDLAEANSAPPATTNPASTPARPDGSLRQGGPS